jgi:hypothetical protein
MLTPQYKLSIEEIYLPGQTANNNYICENFIVYPHDKEKYGGFIFGIIEIKGTPKPEGEKIIQALVNTVKEKYYQQILASPQPQRLNLETVLEYALQKANEVLLEMMQIGYITIRKENLNFIIAVAKPDIKNHETTIYFTQHGLTQAFLLHKSSKGGYKAINVLESGSAPDDRSQKLFSSTIAGKLNLHDRFFVSTESFSNVISPYQVSKICEEHAIAGTKDYLRALILNNASASNFLTNSAIIIGQEKESISSEQPISQLSMNELISTTEHTEKLLMPTIALNLNEKVQSFIARLTRKEKKQAPLQLPTSKQKTLLWNRFPFAIFYYLIIGVKNAGAFVTRVATGKQKLNGNTVKKGFSNLKSKLFNVSMTQKVTIIAIIGAVIALIASIALIHQHNINKANAEVYAAQVEQIKLKLNDAQFALIAQNERESLEDVIVAEDLFKQLPNETSAERASNETLFVQITNLKNQLLHIEKALPQIFTELVANGQPAIGNGLDFSPQLNELVSFAGPNLYIINPDTKNIDNIASTSQDIRDVSLDEKNIFVSNVVANELFQYGDDKKLQKLNFEPVFIPMDFALYNNLYLLKTDDNQIYKAKKSGTTFSAPQPWLKIDSPLQQPISMSIDGNIFVVDGMNKIYKFYAGKMENFMDPIIEPKPEKITKIFTNADSKYLYAFDPAGKRVVVLNKEGELVKQYIFEALDSVTDFTINEKSKTIYLLSGSKIYSASLTHL